MRPLHKQVFSQAPRMTRSNLPLEWTRESVTKHCHCPVENTAIAQRARGQCQWWAPPSTWMHHENHWGSAVSIGAGKMRFSVFYSRFLKKLNTELPYNPGLPWIAIHLKEVRTDIRTHMCAQMFIAALFTITKKKKCGNNQISICWWRDKQNEVYAQDGILHSHKKDQSTDTWYNAQDAGKNNTRESSKAQKGTYCVTPFI